VAQVLFDRLFISIRQKESGRLKDMRLACSDFGLFAQDFGLHDSGTSLSLPKLILRRSKRIARRVIVILPQPRVEFVRLDHEKMKLIELEANGLWLIVPGGNDADAAICDLAYRRGEEIIVAAAADPELAEPARDQAERIIGCIFEPIFWKIEVRWRP